MNNSLPHLIHLAETDSTNKYLQKIAETNELLSGSIVLADYQTAGRGQLGNAWESEADKNLTFSILFRPANVPANRPFVISEMVSLSLLSTLNQYISNVSVKWPNDIYHNDRKIVGILIENTLTQGLITQSIIGIGINVNQTEFRSNAPNPVSLAQITGATFDKMEILETFLQQFARQSERLNRMTETNNSATNNDKPDNSQPNNIGAKTSGPHNAGSNDTGTNTRFETLEERVSIFETIHNDYLQAIYRKDGFYKYADREGTFEARIHQIEPDGHLILKRTDGHLSRYAFKEVAFIL